MTYEASTLTTADVTMLSSLFVEDPADAPVLMCCEHAERGEMRMADVIWFDKGYCSTDAAFWLGALPSLAHSAFASRVSV